MVMGDLVLLEEELNPVMDKLRASGFEITAVQQPTSPLGAESDYLGKFRRLLAKTREGDRKLLLFSYGAVFT